MLPETEIERICRAFIKLINAEETENGQVPAQTTTTGNRHMEYATTYRGSLGNIRKTEYAGAIDKVHRKYRDANG